MRSLVTLQLYMILLIDEQILLPTGTCDSVPVEGINLIFKKPMSSAKQFFPFFLQQSLFLLMSEATMIIYIAGTQR